MGVTYRDIFSSPGVGVSIRDVFVPLAPPVVVDPNPNTSITDAWLTEAGEYYQSEDGSFYFQLSGIVNPEPGPTPGTFSLWNQTDVTFSELGTVTFSEMT